MPRRVRAAINRSARDRMQRFDFPSEMIPQEVGSTEFMLRTGPGNVGGLSVIFREAFFSPRNIGEDKMTQRDNPSSVASHFLKPRRVALLASVAAVSIAALISGADLYRPGPLAWISPAAAAETMAQPSSFADLVARVKPAVISVRVRLNGSGQISSFNRSEENAMPFRQGSPLDRFLRRFGLPNDSQQTPRNLAGQGSGFFISADGYAVTNNHVVEHAKTVEVVTDDGKILPAKVIGTDPRTDLALIKVDGSDFPFVKFADHEPRIGDWVIAVGNPFGLGGTVTAGVVSARGRDIGSGPYDDYLQIDAPMNKGNSGGPSFDINGNVIGVNTAIFSPSGGSVGIGFDIPSDTVKTVIAQLKDYGHVTRGWMGVQIQAVTPDIADSLGLKTAEGAIVDEPQRDSPAAKAGIVAGDVITTLDGAALKDSHSLARKIGAMAPGTPVKLGVLHNGSEKNVTLTLGTLPDERQANAGSRDPSENGMPRLGLTLAPAGEVGAGNQGVAVTAVDPSGPAAERGMESGDIILDVAGKAVSNPSDVTKEIADLHKAGKHTVLMRVKSGNATKFVAIPFGDA
jgi:serine protease Do